MEMNGCNNCIFLSTDHSILFPTGFADSLKIKNPQIQYTFFKENIRINNRAITLNTVHKITYLFSKLASNMAQSLHTIKAHGL